MASPIEQFQIKKLVPLKVPGLDVDASFTNSSVFMLLAVGLTALFFTYAMRGRSLVPTRMQSMAELTYEFVANTVVSRLMDLQLETGVPMLSAVLTPHHFHEHVEHRKYFHQHFAVKGTEAAHACVQTIAGLQRLDALLAA